VAVLDVAGLDEISGAAASEAVPGLVWVHNDSGGGFEIWALDGAGNLRARRTLTGSRHEDWEDMALGPCSLPDEEGCRCLWVGDMGGEREELTIWRVAEPDPERDGEPTVHVETVPLAYPDGAHDAETLLLHPSTGEALILTREEDVGARIYRLPLAPQPASSEAVRLEHMGSPTWPGGLPREARGGAVSPGGSRIALRTDDEVLVYPIEEGQSLVEALSNDAWVITVHGQPDGEGITFDIEEGALWLFAEGEASSWWSIPCVSAEGSVIRQDLPTCEVPEEEGCSCGKGEGAGLLLPALLWGLHRGRRRSPREGRQPTPSASDQASG
jgi:hypothetical protein